MFIPNNPLKKYPGLKIFSLEAPFKISLYAIWKRRDENLISIRKLKDLIDSKLSQVPDRYKDIDLQIEASDVSNELLT
jgi:LysR family transcriptional activator of nhaA